MNGPLGIDPPRRPATLSTTGGGVVRYCVHVAEWVADLADAPVTHREEPHRWTSPASPGGAATGSVGVDQLANRRDLASQLVIARRFPGDLVAGVQDRGVVPVAEPRADAQQRDDGFLAHQEQRDLPGHHDRLVALLALEPVQPHALRFTHRTGH